MIFLASVVFLSKFFQRHSLLNLLCPQLGGRVREEEAGFLAQACATARAAFGWPMFLASAEYVQVEPLGMPLIQSQHFFGK